MPLFSFLQILHQKLFLLVHDSDVVFLDFLYHRLLKILFLVVGLVLLLILLDPNLLELLLKLLAHLLLILYSQINLLLVLPL
jgi:hypothetical protein